MRRQESSVVSYIPHGRRNERDARRTELNESARARVWATGVNSPLDLGLESNDAQPLVPQIRWYQGISTRNIQAITHPES